MKKINRQQVFVIALIITLTAAFGIALSTLSLKPTVTPPRFERQLFGEWEYKSVIPNTLTSYFKKTDTDVTVRVERENTAIEFAYPFQNTKITDENNTLTYQSPTLPVATKYSLTQNGIKEELILQKIPQESVFTSALKTVGVQPTVNAEGVVAFYDQRGEYQFHFERPFVKDGAGNVSYNVKYQLKKTSGEVMNSGIQKNGADVRMQLLDSKKTDISPALSSDGDHYTLYIEVDPDWLHNPARVLPIIIDPTVTHNTSSQFASGQFNDVADSGNGNTPQLETYYQELSSDQNTVGLWHLNEASGNTADSSGNSNTGVPTGTSVVPGLFGNARSFNGTSAYLQTTVAAGSSLDVDTNPVTMEAWVKLTSTANNQMIVARGDYGTDGYGLRFNSSTGKFNLGSHGGSNFDGVTTVLPNTWYHVAGVINGSDSRLYVNGILENIGTVNVVASSGNFYIGADNDASVMVYFFSGVIDEVRVSRTARTAEEIKASAARRPSGIYTSGVVDLTKVAAWNSFTWTEGGVQTGDGETPFSTTNLVAHWKLNETSGTTATNYGTCGGTCNGTLTGFSDTSGRDMVAGSGWTQRNRRWGEGAVTFNGSSDYITVPAADGSPLDIDSGAVTMEAWVKPNYLDSTTRRIMLRGTGGSCGYGISIGVNGNNKFNLGNTGGGNFDSTASATLDRWYHVVGVVNGANSEIYVNGKLDARGTVNPVACTALPLNIGRDPGNANAYFSGTIDAVRVYNRALGAAEILSNYNASNVEIQTRVGNSSSPDDGTWEAWKPTTQQTQLESFDATESATRVYKTSAGDPSTNQTWIKKNNAIPSPSDTSSTDGRIPIGTAGKSDQTHAFAPAVLYDNGVYKMWYLASDGTNARISYATSPDGLTWTKYDNTIQAASDTTGTNGRIPLGTAGKGDSNGVGYASVIKDGNTYKMWYSGSDGTNWRIFYATSPDGLTWTKYDNTIPSTSNTTGTNGRIPLGVAVSGDDGGTLRPTVIKDGSTYKMWYSGANSGTWRIYYATSPNGLTWTKYDNTIPTASDTTGTNGRVPVGSAGTADANHAYEPTVIKDGNIYKMWYNAHRGTVQINYATSPDGLTWTKYNNLVEPISDSIGTLGRIPTGSLGDLTHAYSPSVVKVGNQYKMWYSGQNTSYRIYQATMTSLPLSETWDSTIKSEGTASSRLSFGPQIDGGTVALWHLDETTGSGAYIKDSSPNSIHATPTNTTTVNGVLRKAKSFNGTSSYVSVPASSALDVQQLTIEAWVYSTNFNQNGFVFEKTTNGSVNTQYSCFFNATDTFYFRTYNSGAVADDLTITTSSFVKNNSWNHIACVYNGNSKYIYVNGVLAGAKAYNQTLQTNPAGTSIIGAYGSGVSYFFNGKIDEVRISRVARTAEEISENFRSGENHYINRSISPVDLQNKKTLPFMIAADRPGNYLSATIGESEYTNNQTDSGTVGLWHLNDNKILNWTDTFPGTSTTEWTEIDPNANKVSISSGVQLAAGAAAAWDSGVISNNAFSNQVGNQLYAKVTTGASVAAPNHMMIGWGQDQVANASYTTISHALYFNAGGFYVYQDGTLVGGPYGSGFAINTTYEVLITINATGTASYQVRGGAYTTWTTLLAADAAKTNVNLRAQVAQYQFVGTINTVSVYSPSVSDSSGNGNNGTLLGPYISSVYDTSRTGIIGKAKNFNGTSDYIDIPDSPSLRVGNPYMTLDFWINPGALTSCGADGAPVCVFLNKENSYEFGISSTGKIHYAIRNTSPGWVWTNTSITTPSYTWSYVSITYDGNNIRSYLNGVLMHSVAGTGTIDNTTYKNGLRIGARNAPGAAGSFYPGMLDEIRLSNVVRTPEEIRQAFEMNLRTHPITIDFGAKLDSGNLITDASDSAFIVDATYYGFNQKGSNIYNGDKIIVRENNNGTDYIAQGTVTSVVPSTGAITVSAWDGGSSIPVGGYTANADVFKWQKEYWDISFPLNTQLDYSDLLTLRITNGNEGRTIWLDDLTTNGDYLTNSIGSTIASSTGYRYFQYRTIFHSDDEYVTASMSALSLQYTQNTAPNTPTLNSPTTGSTAISRTPTLYTTATDPNSDYLRYKIVLCTDSNMTQNCQTFDQTSSQTNWGGQSTQNGTAYLSGNQASYTVTTPLNYITTYYWKSYAIDPDGINTWSATQVTPNSFTTTAVEAPTNCKVTRTNNTNVIEWSDNATSENGYAIQRSINGGGWTNLSMSMNPNTVSYVDSPIQNNTSYQYRIAAYLTGPQYSSWCTTSLQSINVGTLQFTGNFNFSGIEVK